MASETTFRARLRWGVRCPGYYLLRVLAGPHSKLEENYHRNRCAKSVAVVTNSPIGDVRRILAEAAGSSRLRIVRTELATLPYLGTFRAAPQLYAIVRLLQPSTVVETGVGAGYSTATILEALNRNAYGHLYSLDLPNSDEYWKLPNGRTPGFLVPPELTNRWNLTLGPSRTALPTLLSRVGEIQLFLHDSDHSYQNMRFEFECAYKSLAGGGLLLADDAMWNSALLDFARQVRQPIRFVYHDGGSAPVTAIRKPG